MLNVPPPEYYPSYHRMTTMTDHGAASTSGQGMTTDNDRRMSTTSDSRMNFLNNRRMPTMEDKDIYGSETLSLYSDNGRQPPPAYIDSLCLSLYPNIDPFPPQSLQMVGSSRSPDFMVSTSKPETALFKIETDSTLVYHETSIQAVQQNFNLFYMKRKNNGSRWRYEAHSKGGITKGVKMFEIETTSKLLSPEGSSTKMVFRNSRTGELDAIYLQIPPNSDEKTQYTITYRDDKVGSMRNLGTNRSPNYSMKIDVPGVDPLLFVMFALAVDDRSMTSRRRLRRPLGSGFAGIGKGPGAGLAGAYAIGAM